MVKTFIALLQPDKKVYFQVINPSEAWPLMENLRAPLHVVMEATC